MSIVDIKEIKANKKKTFTKGLINIVNYKSL